MLSPAFTVPGLFAVVESLNVPEPLWMAAWGVGLIGASILWRLVSDRGRESMPRRSSAAPGRA